jgi:hypothetical protein
MSKKLPLSDENSLSGEIPLSDEIPPEVPPTEKIEPAKKTDFDRLPPDHPIHQLARRIWEGTEKFDAFHAIREDGTHLFVDIQRFTNTENLGNLRPHPKIQTGYIGTLPEIGRMSDWAAKASAYNQTKPTNPFFQNDGTHSIFLKNVFFQRVLAMLSAINSVKKAGFADKLQVKRNKENQEIELKTPYPIEKKSLKKYLAEVLSVPPPTLVENPD